MSGDTSGDMGEEQTAGATGMTVRTRSGHATDPGKVRSNNEDAFFAEYPVFVVADGMGGQAAGEVASSIAVAQMATLAEMPAIGVQDVVDAVKRANQAVIAATRESRELAGMATTLVGLVAVEGGLGSPAEREHPDEKGWAVFNVGDSRIYRSDGSGLQQLSVDHSEVQALVDAGRITPMQARFHPARHIVTRAIGTVTVVEPDVWLLPRRAGERFLICSDGLTNELDDDSLAFVLHTGDDPASTAESLVRRANEAGGRDNITVIVVDIESQATSSCERS